MRFQKGHKVNVGRECSEEKKKKISDSNKGKIVSAESREKMRIAQTGKKLSQETIDKMVAHRIGKKLSEETKRKISESHLKNTGGVVKDKSGYILISAREHPFSNNSGYVREHRLVMEKHLGRYLLPEEQVHHNDGNPENNAIENLRLFASNSEHMAFHGNKASSVKLSMEQIVEIKKLRLSGLTLKQIAEHYPVHFATISKILKNPKYDGLCDTKEGVA